MANLLPVHDAKKSEEFLTSAFKYKVPIIKQYFSQRERLLEKFQGKWVIYTADGIILDADSHQELVDKAKHIIKPAGPKGFTVCVGYEILKF